MVKSAIQRRRKKRPQSIVVMDVEVKKKRSEENFAKQVKEGRDEDEEASPYRIVSYRSNRCFGDNEVATRLQRGLDPCVG